MIKRIQKHIFITILLIFTLFKYDNVYAASGSISVTTSKSSVIVGESITATVTVSSGASIGGWEFSLNYDSSMLRLTSTQHNPHIVDYAANSNTKRASYTYTFSALKTGSTRLSLSGASLYGWDEKEMQLSLGSRNISIINRPVVNYSTNNFLSSLSVDGYSISPTFKKDVLTYNLEVENDVNKIKVNAAKEDSTASVTGTGERSVSEGMNKIEVKVTAQNGNVRTYVINARVKELEPIEVTIDGKKYTVVRKQEELTMPLTYIERTSTINDEEVPSFYSEFTKFTLIGLKDAEGNIGLYIYDEKDNTYELYNELDFNKLALYIKEPGKSIHIPSGYNKTKITINDTEITAYKFNSKSKYSLIYGMNIETGEEHLYMYDSEENTIQRYNGEEVSEINKKLSDYTVIITSLALFSFISFIIIIFFIIKNRKIIKRVAAIESNVNGINNTNLS